MSRGFHNLARDNGFWRARCLQESTFLETLDRRRRLLNNTNDLNPWLPTPRNGQSHGTPTTTSNNATGILDGVLDVDGDGDGAGDGQRRPRREGGGGGGGPPISVYSAADARERERVRIMANWDPCFPSERVSWYDEYIHRHGPVAVSWMQNAYDGGPHGQGQSRGPGQGAAAASSAADFVEARGVALYYPDGEAGEAVLAVSPLDDGGVCMWDVAGTRGRRGAIVARSRPGILFIDGPGADNSRRSKRIDSGVTECVSVDSWQHRAFFAVQSRKCDLNRDSKIPSFREVTGC